MRIELAPATTSAAANSAAPKPAAKAPPAAQASAQDTVELSPQAQKLVAAQPQVSTQSTTQEDSLLAAAQALVTTNPTAALAQLQNIIAQYPNSAAAQKAQILLAMLAQPQK